MSKVYPVDPAFAAKARIRKDDYERLYAESVQDPDRFWGRVAERLDVGAVAINAWSPIDARLPWGGTKQSGIGRDLSQAALDSYLEEKIITAAL